MDGPKRPILTRRQREQIAGRAATAAAYAPSSACVRVVVEDVTDLLADIEAREKMMAAQAETMQEAKSLLFALGDGYRRH